VSFVSSATPAKIELAGKKNPAEIVEQLIPAHRPERTPIDDVRRPRKAGAARDEIKKRPPLADRRPCHDASPNPGPRDLSAYIKKRQQGRYLHSEIQTI